MIESQAELPARDTQTEPRWSAERDGLISLEKGRGLGSCAHGDKRHTSSTRRRFAPPGWAERRGVQEWWARAKAYSQSGSIWSRYALHLVIVLLAVGVVGVGQITFPVIDFALPTPTPAPELGERAAEAPTTSRGGVRFVSSSIGLFQNPVPHTIVPERHTVAIITYTVQPNDNVWSIATGFGLEPETIVWANSDLEKSPDLLSVGQVLTILPVDGVYYTVGAGDTVDKVAKEFQTEAEAITAFELNNLEEPYTLTPASGS